MRKNLAALKNSLIVGILLQIFRELPKENNRPIGEKSANSRKFAQ
jgi:hypothetical protein